MDISQTDSVEAVDVPEKFLRCRNMLPFLGDGGSSRESLCEIMKSLARFLLFSNAECDGGGGNGGG